MIVRLHRRDGRTVPALLVREECGHALVHYVERTPPPPGWIGRDAAPSLPRLARVYVPVEVITA